VECHDHRYAEGPDEVEDEAAVLSAPDALSVLNADNLDAAVVEGLGTVGIVELDVATNPVADLSRIRPDLARRMDGHDLAFTDRRGQIVRERGEATLARRVG
jgi:hypothetical protein